ncbi:MAG: hypothetical protein AB7I27_19670 [Bacteriovoracaceae bacterium]
MFTKEQMNKAVVVLTVLGGMSLNQIAHASCTSQIRESITSYFKDADKAFSLGVTSVVFGVIAPPMAIVGAVSSSAAAVSTTVDDSTELNHEEGYAYEVLLQSEVNVVKPELASFIKQFQKLVAKDPHAVIPTDNEIIETLNIISQDSICLKDGKFIRPIKKDLIDGVKDYLNL